MHVTFDLQEILRNRNFSFRTIGFCGSSGEPNSPVHRFVRRLVSNYTIHYEEPPSGRRVTNEIARASVNQQPLSINSHQRELTGSLAESQKHYQKAICKWKTQHAGWKLIKREQISKRQTCCKKYSGLELQGKVYACANARVIEMFSTCLSY